MNNRAVLLANLGSPDAPDTSSVRKYLNQFLMDPSVLQLPWIIRRLIVSLFVLPSRPKNSALAYQQVWMDEGSPLVVLSMRLLQALSSKTDIPMAMSMRYGNPSIESQLLSLASNKEIEEILFIPLYPHYAESTVGTSIKEAERVIAKHGLKVRLNPLKPFYDNPDYIKALHEGASPWLNETEKFEHILFSYHGLPELHITKEDVTGAHCLKQENCCSTPSPSHEKCYRHQVFRTTECFVTQAGLNESQYTVAFQSRLGRAKWLEPSTEETLVKLAKSGVKNLLVICPAFVTDCLETLEEIEIRGEEIFKESGGVSLKLIPCLNDQASWVNTLQKWVENPN
jgi:protoporphyrin/coproporphyrin ferrochelatase